MILDDPLHVLEQRAERLVVLDDHIRDLNERTERAAATRREINRRRTAELTELKSIRTELKSPDVNVEDLLVRLSALESRQAVTLERYDSVLSEFDQLDAERKSVCALFRHRGLRQGAGAA